MGTKIIDAGMGKLQRLIVVLLGMAMLILTGSCSRSGQEVIEQNEAFSNYINSYTSGVISARGEVVVRLASDFKEGQRTNKRLFSLEPTVEGEEVWLDDRTVAFRPDRAFDSGTNYIASFRVGALYDVSEDLQQFRFDFETIRQDMEVQIGGIEPSPEGDRSRQQLKGTVFTADVTNVETISEVLEAEQDGRSLKVDWQQDTDQTVHHFTVQNIVRAEQPGEVELAWDGQTIGAATRGQHDVIISSLSAFELVQTRVIREANPHVELVFSDALDERQNFRGLIRIGADDNIKVIVQENRLRVYPRNEVKGERTLRLSPGLRSRQGKRLAQQVSRTILLHQPKPKVRFVGKGVIIPDSEELLLPFEAVSLGAVDVQVMRIFQNNIAQFLQDNSLSGNYALKQVGRSIVQETVPLSSLGAADVSTWNGYALDLSKLIEPEPGAIYQVKVGFRQHQIVYPCGEGTVELSKRSWTLDPVEEERYWKRFDDYYYPANFDWRERDNPCHGSYYTSNRYISRNVLASDLGLIAKQGEVGNLQVMTTNLKTAEPKPGVELEIFDFQQQQLGTATSDAQGMAEVDTERKPFLLVAKDGQQRGYLKLDDGSALSLSDFDVSGAKVNEGIKGFLYGERGVWRPGDSLFVTLIVEDEQDVLPDNHPVTFDLRNPSGQVVDRTTMTDPINGFYTYRTKTGPDAPTGNWTVRARLGGNAFTKTVKVETVKPNRLKVEMNPADERLTANDRTLNGTISARWLHGATAGNLDTDISMTLREGTIRFDDYEDYSFDDPSRSLDAATEEIFKGKLNSSGTVPFSYTFGRMNNVPGALWAGLLTRVFEESGNFSVNRSSIPYYPYPVIAGVRLPDPNNRWGMLESDSTHTLDVVSLDIDGNPVPGRRLHVQIFKVDWRWWWERSNKNLSQYFSNRSLRPVFSRSVTTNSSGRSQVNFRLEDEDWGRFMVRVSDPRGGHAAGETFYLGWSYFRNNKAGNPARLTFESDKDRYRVGEEVSLTIPGSRRGKALVSLETGSRMLQRFWVDTRPGQTQVNFLASKEMTPNVYAHVMLLQPHGQKQNDRPLRMYGVIPIAVEDPSTKLNPVVDLPAEMRPETSVQIEVSEENSQAMTYTVAMVDEGLLDLTNFKTPEPYAHFYAREALGVKTWDLFNHVAGAYAGSLNRILSIGGDEDLDSMEQPEEANRFEPMVRFLGPFNLRAGGTNRHQVDIPNYVGSVRTMVIAGQDGAYGQSEVATPIRKPVMVLGTLPRVLGPGEEVSLPVSVFAMEDGIDEVEARVQASDIFEVVGSSEQQVSFDEPGEATIRYNLRVKSRTGAGKVRIEARGDGESAYHEIEIEVRNPNPSVTNVYEKALDAGETWNLDYNPVGLWGTNTGILEVSSIPPIDLGRRLRYLMRYPHGCVEQVTSAAFPQLYLHHITDMNAERKEKIQEHVDEAIKRLQSYQVASGGLGYWPDHSHSDEWGTSYAYHFLLEAKSNGYYVPSDLLDNLRRYQQRRASSWQFVPERSRNDDLAQAYRLYTLALDNRADLGAMNRLREHQKLSVQALWRLAAAYSLAGQPEAARGLVQGITKQVAQYRELSHTYGSDIRDRAMILETLSIMERREDAVPLMREIAEALNEKHWMSTQTTAYSLIAIARFLEIAEVAEEVKVQYGLGAYGQGSVSSTAPVSQVDFYIKEEGSQTISVTNNSNGVVFARLIQEGVPLVGDGTAASNNLVQKVRYLNLEGEEVDPGSLQQGMDVIAEVTVSNPGMRGDLKELALTQIFPSGWEIRNSRMDDIKFKEPTSSPAYQDIRDDRVYTYFDLPANESKTFRIMLNASYTGRYYLPTVSTSAMYDETINARKPGQWVEVNLPE